MIRFNRKVWIAALGAGAISSFMMLPSVHAELVYENGASEPTQATSQVSDAQLNDRANLRQTLESSQKAQATILAQAQTAPASSVQVQQIAPAPVAAAAPAVPAPAAAPAVAPAPLAAAPAPIAVAAPAAAPVVVLSAQPAITPDTAAQANETQNLSHAEIIRRERMREELKNEDVLQTRLEELRMKDEQKRTSQILAPAPDASAPAAATSPIQQQIVTPPAIEHPGQPSAAVPTFAPGQQVASLQGSSSMDQSGAVGTSTARDLEPASSQKPMFSLTALGGISNITSNNIGYSISPQFSTGVAASLAATDYVSIQLGYTYSQYGVSMNSYNSYYNNGVGLQSLQLNQNVFSAGAKVDLLGPDSKIRPFVSAGLAYSKGYVNYNSTTLSYINANPYAAAAGQDYDVSQFLGYVGGGIDVQLTRNISIGVDFKYYDALSSSDNGGLNNEGFYNNVSLISPDKQYVGGSLASANFYTVMAGLTFSM
jgi:hypothetical protein